MITKPFVTATEAGIILNEIKNVLIANLYGQTTIHYYSTVCLIFSNPNISSNVIKLTTFSTGYGWCAFSIGSAWESDTTITNERFLTRSVDIRQTLYSHILINEKTLVFLQRNSDANTYSVLTMFGEIENGKKVAMSLITGGAYSTGTGYNLTENCGIRPILIGEPFTFTDGTIAKSPLLLLSDVGAVETNLDGSFASFYGIWSCSFANNSTIPVTMNNVLYTEIGFRNALMVRATGTSFMIPLNTEF